MYKSTMWRIFNKIILLNIAFLLILPLTSMAQTSEIPAHIESYNMNSGIHSGAEVQGDKSYIAYTGLLEISDSPWLRLIFDDANLGKNSYIIITSILDGKWQKLDATSIEQWQLTTAYFNGDKVQIELHLAPLDRNIYFNIKEVLVGDYIGDDNLIDTQCGPTDDRVSSNQPATGRLMTLGCTAWIIPNGDFISAGHCLDGGGINVVQFQVPPSLPNGTPQNPGPEDQYAVNLSTIVFVAAGVGNDWGTFEVFPNSITGLLPKEAQGAFWPLVQDLDHDPIRITGYGVDSGVDDQTQQTHLGPNAGSSGTTMRYVTDTRGGNSGSPVIDEATGNAVGVHTHGGCNGSGGNNHGTSFFNTAFWNAVMQGTVPVELINFASTILNGDIKLEWATATETNNMGFEIQRSYNGTEFSRVAFVEGHGTVTETQNYTYSDKNLEVGTYTYRLKQTDFDGTSEFSDAVEVEVIAPDVYALEQNYPNPFNPSTKIKFSLAADSKVILTVFDVLGQEVVTLINGNLSAGSHDIDFNAANIHSGVYFYRIDAIGIDGTNFTSVKKMILTK